MSFNFADVFTVAARHIVPAARARGLSFAFDCVGARIELPGDPGALQGSLHRVFHELVHLMEKGGVVISARAEMTDHGGRVCVEAAGAGLFNASELGGALSRLQLEPCEPSDFEPGTITARGLSPHSGISLQFTAVPSQGLLFTQEITCLSCAPVDETPLPDAHCARAWLVNLDDPMAASWTRRLQRLGWAVSRFASYDAAEKQLMDSPTARPGLVLVLETGDPALDGTLNLPAQLPDWSRLVYAVQAGAATLRHASTVTGYEVHVYPLTPRFLEELTTQAEARERGAGTTVPAPLTSQSMTSVLIVDDTPVNLVVGRGFAEALGYSVRTAVDGLDAIEACRQEAPHVLLMDLQMPRLGGIECTRRLRLLQQSGDIPPFPIIINTAGWSPEIRQECLAAGADECLAKPITLPLLAEELSRVSSYR